MSPPAFFRSCPHLPISISESLENSLSWPSPPLKPFLGPSLALVCALVETCDPLFWKYSSETSGPLDYQWSSSILGCLQLKLILAIVWEERLVFGKLVDIAAFSFSLDLFWMAMSLTLFLIYIFSAFLRGGGHVTQWWSSGHPLGGIWKKRRDLFFLPGIQLYDRVMLEDFESHNSWGSKPVDGRPIRQRWQRRKRKSMDSSSFCRGSALNVDQNTC